MMTDIDGRRSMIGLEGLRGSFWVFCGSAVLGLTCSEISARHEKCLLTARAQKICLCQEVTQQWGTRGLEGEWRSWKVPIPWLLNLSLASVPESACFLGKAHVFSAPRAISPCQSRIFLWRTSHAVCHTWVSRVEHQRCSHVVQLSLRTWTQVGTVQGHQGILADCGQAGGTFWLPVVSTWLREGFNLHHSQASALLWKEPNCES